MNLNKNLGKKIIQNTLPTKSLYVLSTFRNLFTFWSALSATRLISILAQVPIPSCSILSVRFPRFPPQFWNTVLLWQQISKITSIDLKIFTTKVSWKSNVTGGSWFNFWVCWLLTSKIELTPPPPVRSDFHETLRGRFAGEYPLRRDSWCLLPK